MIQAGAKTQAFKGLKQKKICRLKNVTTRGDSGLYMVKSRCHWSGFSILDHKQPSKCWSGSLDHFVFLPVYAMPKKKGRK